MKLRTLLAIVALAAFVAVHPAAQTPVIGVDEIRPGMVGIGRTVFSGDRIEEFKVHIIGVLKNVVGPNRDIVLARLEGGPLAQTGVIAGMSGSPVYIDGRLLGAVSYQLGQFPKEPIAGITPIGEMTDATALGPPTPGTRPVEMSWPPKSEELIAIWSRDLGRVVMPQTSAPALLAGDANLLQMASMLRPITVPLVSSGFSADVLAPIAPALAERGFLPVSSSSEEQPRTVSTANRTLRP
jgi:hypothetical protein